MHHMPHEKDALSTPALEKKQCKKMAFMSIPGIIIVVSALCVILGWLTHDLELAQLYLHFHSMHFNTALCFLFCGCGMIALAWHKTIAAMIFSTVPLTIGFFTFVDRIWSLGMNVDYLFTNAMFSDKMASNTALSFAFCGLALLL